MLDNDIAAAPYRLALESGARDDQVFDRLQAAVDRYPPPPHHAPARLTAPTRPHPAGNEGTVCLQASTSWEGGRASGDRGATFA